MDPLTASIIASLATNYFTQFTAPVIEGFFAAAFERKPSLEVDLRNARTPQDFDRVFREAVGVIDAAAGDGSISVDGAFLSALRGIRFDHQHGTVTILGSTLSAPILQTGGSDAGVTTISAATLKSQGTAMQVGKGASIVITGNASIRQS